MILDITLDLIQDESRGKEQDETQNSQEASSNPHTQDDSNGIEEDQPKYLKHFYLETKL